MALTMILAVYAFARAWWVMWHEQLPARVWCVAASGMSLVLPVLIPILYFLGRPSGFWRSVGILTVPLAIGIGGVLFGLTDAARFVIHHKPSNIRLTGARGKSRSIRPTVTSHLFHRSSWCSRLKNWNGGWATSQLVAGCTGSHASEILQANQPCYQTGSTISSRSSVGIVRSSFLFLVVHATGRVVNKISVCARIAA